MVRRALLRGTWLNQHLLEKSLGLKVKIIFVVGMSDDDNHNLLIHYENALYKDILQVKSSTGFEEESHRMMESLL